MQECYTDEGESKKALLIAKRYVYVIPKQLPHHY